MYILVIGYIILWILFIVKFGFGIISFIIGLIGLGTVLNSIDKVKATSYLADKYDEERRKNKK